MKLNSYNILLRILPYIWLKTLSMRMRIIAMLILTTIMIAISISIPFMFKWVINILVCINKFSHYTVVLILTGYGICWLLDQVIRQIREMFVFRILENGISSLSLDTFNKLHKLTHQFHVNRQTGALISDIEKARYGFEAICWGIMSFLLPTIIEISISIILLTYIYGITYGAIMFFIMASYLVFSIIFLDKASKAREDYNQKRSLATARMVDSLLNYETVKYFNNEEYENQHISNMLKIQEDFGVKSLFLSSWVNIGQGIIIGLGLLCITLISGNAAYYEMITIGDFVLINGYLLQFVMPLTYFGHILQQVRKGIQDMSSNLQILDLKSDIQDSHDAVDLIASKAEIKFDKVSFYYNTDREILHNITFTVPAGKTLAIVGTTGSGKSTIARLLFRFYDPSSGTILINGQDIKSIAQNSLHKIIGVVAQDTALFNDTLYYNIAYGNTDAEKHEIQRAAHLACLDDFISSLPDGYNTIVGERGLKLSGGEKQRIAIARAILKKPVVYVFDETTSSLDMQTEAEIKKNLENISTDITTIIIAHRLSTIINADNIIVLDNGTIVEQGSHQELIDLKGIYYKLWNLQIKKTSQQ